MGALIKLRPKALLVNLPHVNNMTVMITPTRWRSILLGLSLGLFVSAALTSNFAGRFLPLILDHMTSGLQQQLQYFHASNHSNAPTVIPYNTTSSTSSSASSQLFFNFLWRNHSSATSAMNAGNSSRSFVNASRTIPAVSSSASSSAETVSINTSDATQQKIKLHLNGGGGGISASFDKSPRNANAREPRDHHAHDINPKKSSGINQGLLAPSSNANYLNTAPAIINSTEETLGLGFNDDDRRPSTGNANKYCDASDGTWFVDGSYPLYQPGRCPFVDEAFSCYLNGRPDSNYTRWKWVPRDCTIPRFNGTDFLERMKGKRLVFVGDSLNRDQWESMLCMLWESLADKTKIVEVRGGRISKLPGAYVFKFLDYNNTVEFYTSHFLVDEEDGSSNQTQFTVRLDRIDKSERRWRKADVLIFNTGHWWTSDKIGDGDNYFREGGKVHGKLSVEVAYRRAMETWAQWVDKHVNASSTRVFFRSYSPAHYLGGQWNSGGQCHNQNQPIFNRSFLSPYPDKMLVMEEVISRMTVPVHILNVTRLSDFRKDAHPAIYGAPRHHHTSNTSLSNIHQDCSHWCLPGLPDTWNELLYFTLFFNLGSK